MWNRGASTLGSRRGSKRRNLTEPGAAGQSSGRRSSIGCMSGTQIIRFTRLFTHRQTLGSALQRNCTIREIAFDEFHPRAHTPPHGSLSQRGPRPNAPPEDETPDEASSWRGGGSGISDRNVQPLTPHHPSTALLPGNAPLTHSVSGAFTFGSVADCRSCEARDRRPRRRTERTSSRTEEAQRRRCGEMRRSREGACRRSSRAAGGCDIPRPRRSTADTCPSPSRRSPTRSGSRG